jgi:hypothetical protein
MSEETYKVDSNWVALKFSKRWTGLVPAQNKGIVGYCGRFELEYDGATRLFLERLISHLQDSLAQCEAQGFQD